jgi:hypothetical protein
MKTLRFLALACGVAVFPVAPGWSAAAPSTTKVTSDLVTPQKRQETVDKALRLTRPPVPAPLPADLTQPFNPAGFDQADAEEQRANAAAGVRPVAGPVQPVGPVTDRDLLETIAPRIQPTGYFMMGGKPLLTFPDAKRVRIGDVISVRYNDHEYDVEITAIDRTNFTLRYRGEEITRPIAKTNT